jgi:hypothetical protein
VRKRAALFECLWYDTQTGHALHRASAAELAEAHRLWWKHRDIRVSTARPQSCPEAQPTRRRAPELEDLVADEWTQIGLDGLGPEA